MKVSTYHPNWQKNRLKFILEKYDESFFKGKRILELGAHNGYIGASFASLGAIVHCVEGRQKNVDKIKEDYPIVTVECANLDTPEWTWGHYDIIINFGLYYHLENFHKEHLLNCVNNCDLMFFETVIYDSFEDEIYFRQEEGIDQSLTPLGGTPSTSYVENILKDAKIPFIKHCDSALNGDGHEYDWSDGGLKKYPDRSRRFWIINK